MYTKPLCTSVVQLRIVHFVDPSSVLSAGNWIENSLPQQKKIANFNEFFEIKKIRTKIC